MNCGNSQYTEVVIFCGSFRRKNIHGMCCTFSFNPMRSINYRVVARASLRANPIDASARRIAIRVAFEQFSVCLPGYPVAQFNSRIYIQHEYCAHNSNEIWKLLSHACHMTLTIGCFTLTIVFVQRPRRRHYDNSVPMLSVSKFRRLVSLIVIIIIIA